MISGCLPDQGGREAQNSSASPPQDESGMLSYLLGWSGSAGFGSTSTAEDVAASLALKDHVFLVTGASSSIGQHVAQALASRGAALILTYRDPSKQAAVEQLLQQEVPAADVTSVECDLSSLESIQACAATVQALDRPLHGLIHCAGLLAAPFHLTADGFEGHWGVNYIAAHVLSRLLVPLLRSSASAAARPSRIVLLSCSTHYFTYRTGPQKGRGIDYRRVEGLDASLQYSAMEACGQSKLAGVLLARDLARRLQAGAKGEAGGVEVFAVHPGVTAGGLARYWGHFPGSWVQYLKDSLAAAAGYTHLIKTPQQVTREDV